MRDEMHRRRFFDLVAGTGLAAATLQAATDVAAGQDENIATKESGTPTGQQPTREVRLQRLRRARSMRPYSIVRPCFSPWGPSNGTDCITSSDSTPSKLIICVCVPRATGDWSLLHYSVEWVAWISRTHS